MTYSRYILLTFFLLTSVHAEDLQFSKMDYTKKKEISISKITLKKFNNFLVNESCIKRPDQCLALQKTKELPPSSKKDFPIAVHPASERCILLNGRNIILQNMKNEDFDFCEFKDGSFIDSWNLYYAQSPKEKMK